MGKRVKPKNLLDDAPQIDVVNEQTIEEANVEMKQEYSGKEEDNPEAPKINNQASGKSITE